MTRTLSFVIAIGLAVGLSAMAFAQPGAAQTSPGAGPIIVFETEKGTFEFETYPNEAPKTVAHIVALVNKRFYNGLRFHRVVPNFVVQAGDPMTRDVSKEKDWGHYGSGKPVGAVELSPLRKHVKGAVAMAHAGDAAKADAQFYVCLTAQPRLDGEYVVFGKVISGMDVLPRIQVRDRIIRATVREEK